MVDDLRQGRTIWADGRKQLKVLLTAGIDDEVVAVVLDQQLIDLWDLALLRLARVMNQCCAAGLREWLVMNAQAFQTLYSKLLTQGHRRVLWVKICRRHLNNGAVGHTAQPREPLLIQALTDDTFTGRKARKHRLHIGT